KAPAPRYQKVTPAYLGSGAVKNQKINIPSAGKKNRIRRETENIRLRAFTKLTRLPTRKSESGNVTANLWRNKISFVHGYNQSQLAKTSLGRALGFRGQL